MKRRNGAMRKGIISFFFSLIVWSFSCVILTNFIHFFSSSSFFVYFGFFTLAKLELAELEALCTHGNFTSIFKKTTSYLCSLNIVVFLFLKFVFSVCLRQLLNQIYENFVWWEARKHGCSSRATAPASDTQLNTSICVFFLRFPICTSLGRF